GVYNAILTTGDMLGDAMFYGQGAGKLATASAVVADMIDCVIHSVHRRKLEWVDDGTNIVRPLESFASRWYVRMTGGDAAAKLAEAFPGAEMLKLEGVDDEAACLTAELTTAQMEQAKQALGTVAGSMRVL
ncbi:MAG: homoserine dehydrogenase, partial [Butyricicoccaceae bacterium]